MVVHNSEACAPEKMMIHDQLQAAACVLKVTRSMNAVRINGVMREINGDQWQCGMEVRDEYGARGAGSWPFPAGRSALSGRVP